MFRSAPLGLGPSAVSGSAGGASRAGADPMATSACVEFCCVAKRFDRPFLRLPAEAVPAPDASAGPWGAGDDERRSAADVDARDTDAAAAAVDATAGDAAKLAESTGLDGDAEDSDETEAEETATRVRLDEILRHISERLVSSSRDANAAETDETERNGAGNHATATPHETEMRVDSVDADAECLPVAFLEPLAHMSHRRERHCRVILQHACADAVIRGAALFARRAAAEAPRIFASGDATEASRSDLRDVAFAGELAALLIHNLAIAASVKEPRDDDDSYLDEPAEKHPALAKDGKYEPMTSVVRHARWEGLVRDVFAMCEWLAKRERDKNPYRADQSGARETESAARPPVRAGAETTASSLEKQNENAHDEHAILCRGALGTYTGAFLALLEPDSARPRLLQMDGGAFVLRVFRCMGSILPARHGDAALDAVGVLHRVLWLRPDASARERMALMRALVAMETPLRSLDAGEIERVDRARAEAETRTTDPAIGAPPRASEDASSSAEPLARRGGGHAESQPESEADEQCDPDDLWDWHARDGYCANARPGEPFHPFRWHPESDRRALWRLCEAQAERVSVNGVLAGLRTRLPPPGSAGDGGGAAGGTVACTQAVHALRALFEDLGILDAQAKHERVLMRRAFETRTMWRQLRTAQMRELVEQLACVVETLGQGAPTSGGPDDDDAKKKKKKKKKKTENPYEEPVGSSSARISDDYSGAWRGFKTVVPKEGRCDGAVGASMAVFSAILHHPFQSKTLEEHPGFDGVWNAVTRALGSRCSCAFATFSTVCRLAGKGGYATKRLMSMPSAGCLSRALVSATRDTWPAVALNEMPRTTFLPRRDPRSASDASRWDASRPEDAEDAEKNVLRASRAKRKKKRRRREAWREKTAKDLARDAKAEARKAKQARRDAARAAESATAETPAADVDDADDADDAPRASAERSTPGGDAPDSDTSDSSSSSDSDSEEDPLASSSNRLLLRATAAATLASFAHVQREWDELDRFPSTLSEYDQDATLDAIDVDDGAPDGLWRPRSGEEINQALNVAGIQTPPEACEALELWYAARGGDGAAAPSRGDLRAAREGLRVAFAASRARRTAADRTRPDSSEEIERETDPNGDTASSAASSLRFAREAQIETWWTMRWRNGLFHETRRRESADASPESEGGDSKRDARSDSSSRADDSGNRTVASASEMRLTSWPEHAVRHPQLRKGPLPGGVDPEGVLGTAPLTEDILSFLSRPVVCETAPRDAVSRDALRDTGVAVEAIETLASDDKARFLLLPDAERVLERLAARVDETARLARRAAANGGFLPMDEKRDDDDDDEDETEKNASPANDDEKKTKKKKKKKKKKKTRVSFGDLCARNALIVHTLYSVTKESERENEGSAWPTLIACSDVLLGALHSILAQAREDREPAVAAGEGSQTECDAAATRETVIELCRNVIIVLAEMADPGNSRDTPELGAAWAEGVVTRKPWVLDELVRVMAAGFFEKEEKMKRARGAVRSENLASEDDSFGTPTRLSASVDPSAKMAARFSFPVRADGSDAAPGVASETAPEPEPEPENEDAFSSASGRRLRGFRNPANPAELVLGSGAQVRVFQNPANPRAELVTTFSDVDAQDFQRKNPTWEVLATTNVIHTGSDADPARSYLGGAATDCAHIAAAAVFGVLSWDASLKAFLEREAARDSGLPSAGALISRTVALLSHAWKPTTRASDAFDDAGASIRDPEASEYPHFLEHSGCQSLQALSLRGIESAGLLARLAGDDAGRRALVAHAPGIVGYLAPCLDSRLGQTAAFAARALSGLARGEAGDKQMEKISSRVTPTVLEKYPYPETLVARLAEMLSDQTSQGERELPGAVARRDPGLDAHVLSEAVVAVAALARDKPWRWRLVDVRSTSRSGPPRACGTSEAATRLVANLARLLGDATRPEIAFNALYCVNCLMGEPPQSWGRGRDASREEDHAARRAFIAAASRAQGVPIETRLAEILHPEFTAAAAAAATREEEEEEAPPPDCRLNATLVIANVAGDAEGRRRLLEVAGDRLVAGLAAAIVGPDPERAMLAAYSLGELARPLPGCELALGGAARAERAERGEEDRAAESENENENALDPSFAAALPFLEARGAASPAPFGGTETLETLETLETHPLVAARRARAEAVAASARGAAAAARAVLADGEAHLRDWIARGDETRLDENADSSHATYSYERDHRAQEPLRALPLGVKRKWLLEMLRWELGPVSAGVPLPGVAGVALDVDRAEILRDLCRHCEVPRANSGERERGFGVFGVPGSASAESTESQESQDTDASGDEQTTEAPASPAPASPAPVPKKKRAARGAFLSPPRGGVSVRFVDERGEGAAVRREWFGLVAERSADFTHGLFVSHDGGRSLHPHACSGAINPKTHLKYFAALGRVAAVALYHGETLPLRLTDTFLDRAVLGARASLEDLKSVDPTLYANKVRYLMDLRGSAETTAAAEDAAPTRETGNRETATNASLDATVRALDLEWSDAADPTGVFFPGETRAFTLLPTSLTDKTHPVTAETLATYLRAFVAHRTYGSVSLQTAAFAAGFGAVVPPPLRARMRSVLRGAELSSLVAGEPGAVDAADWRRNTGYADAPLAVSFSTRCFWHALERVLTDAERVDVLRFATGLSAAPAGGFANLVGYAGDAAPFTVAELASDARDAPRALPMAHACFNTIRLPRLAERAFGGSVEAGGEEMARRLRVATALGARGFDNF